MLYQRLKLWPKLAFGRSADGQWSTVASKSINRIIREVGIDDKRLVFRCFRANFISACGACGVGERATDVLVGYKLPGDKDRYDKRSDEVRRLFEAIGKVEYGGKIFLKCS